MRPADSSWLLGHDTITEHAKNLTGRLSDLQGIEYDQGLTDLLHLHNPESSTYRAPTKQSFTYQQYQVALTLLTPVIAVATGVLVLNEPITLKLIIGGGLTLAGVFLVAARENKSLPSDAVAQAKTG